MGDILFICEVIGCGPVCLPHLVMLLKQTYKHPYTRNATAQLSALFLNIHQFGNTENIQFSSFFLINKVDMPMFNFR